MAQLPRASMLTLYELARLVGLDPDRVERMLERARLCAEEFPDGSAVYEWERVASKLSAGLASRAERAARLEGFALRARADTVAGAPHLVAQWNWRRNGSLLPWRVPKMSTLRVWWRCPAGADHEWQQTVCFRNSPKPGGFPGCPYCAGRLVSKTNCLATCAPRIARQWHPTKNGRLTPKQIQAHSSRVVWWRCPKGRDHEWRERVGSRTAPNRTGDCPFCQSRRVGVDNHLAARAPAVAAQWHPTRNAPLTPRDVVPGATRLVWWRCDRGADHVWRQSPKARVLGRGCPFCAGKKTSVTNSLAKVLPALAREWHPTKNGKLRPNDVVPGSAKRVFWRCRRDPSHVWRTTVNARTSGGGARGYRQCPFCAGRIASRSTSLAARVPDIAAEWHPKLNGRLTPHDVTPGMRRKVWWRCSRGHTWSAMIRNRGRNRHGCPKCDLMKRRGLLE